MRNFRNDGPADGLKVVRAVGLLLLLAIGPAWAASDPPLAPPSLGPPLRLGVPQRLTPPSQQEPPAVVGPVKPAGAPPSNGQPASGQPSSDSAPIVIDPLAPIDPDWAGPL